MAKDDTSRTAIATTAKISQTSLSEEASIPPGLESCKLSAEKAVIAFLQPSRMQPNRGQRRFLATATRSKIQVDGRGIVCYTWARRSDSHPVLLSHGYGTSAAAMLDFVPPLLEAGFRVIAWDHTGHGESEGDWGDVAVFIHTIQTLALASSPLAAIIAHSIGATAAMIAVAENPLIRCSSLICMSAPTQMDTVLDRFLKNKKLPAGLSAQMQQIMIEKNILTPIQVQSVQSHNMMQTRLLVIQDRDDKVALVSDAERLASYVVDNRLEITQGLGHFKILSDPGVVRMVAGFVIDGSPNCSSKPLKL